MATRTSATSGDYATGATWVGGIAPVLGDKVIIAHTSTGLQQFSTDATGYAIGATAITLTGTVLAGSYVIGECVQFDNDPNYYQITNWVVGTKVLTVTALIIAIPATATVVRTRGHVITVAGTVAGGDDTTSGITINGTMKASRVATSQFTARGELIVNTSGTLDYGTEADSIPAAYTATIIINDSAAQASNKYGISTNIATKWFGVRFWGASKTVDTTFTSAVASGDTVLNVADTTGWAIGDWLSFGPDTAGATITARVITAVTASTVTIGASLGAARLSGSKLMNVSSNVRVWGSNGNTYTSHISLRYAATQNVTNCIEIGPCEIRLNGGGGAGGTITTQQGGLVINYVSPTNLVNAVKKINGPMVHGYWSVSGSTVTNLASGFTTACYEIYGNQATKITIEKIYAAGLYPCISLYSGASVDVTTIKGFTATTQVFVGNVQGPVDCNINGGYLIGGGRVLSTNGTSINFNNVEIDALTYFYDSTITAFGLITFTNCALGQTIGFGTPATAYVMAAGEISPTIITDCTMLDTFSTDMSATGYKNQQQANYLKIVNRNRDPQRQERYVRGGRNYRSNTVHYRSKYAMTFECWNTATGITETSTIPIDASATIKLIGYVRFNAAFGTATPPTVTISGLGITPQVYTCTATADTWFKYEFDVTNPQIYGGNLTATFYAITASAGATAQCYFDGLIVSPYCTDSRHYGYLFDISQSRTVNSVITETDEATVGAYTGIAIDHTTNTLTLSSNHTIQEVYDYVYYNLVQTANLSEPEWFTSTDGVTFNTSYNIVNNASLTGTATLITTGTYTGSGTTTLVVKDSVGVRCKITSGGGSYTIKGATIAYEADITEKTIVVAPSTNVSFVMWKLGYKPQLFTINSGLLGGTFDITMIDITESIDTGLDVAPIIALTSTTVDGSGYHIFFGEMELSLEQMKATVHRLMKFENYFDAVLATADDNIVEIRSDEIRVNKPLFTIEREASLTLVDRVQLNGYINISNAVVIDPLYIINPGDSDGLYVTYLTVKPGIDAQYLAGVVWNNPVRTITDAPASIGWNDLIENYSDVTGSFGQKFSQYGGVSHVIDRSNLDDESKKHLVGFKDKMEEFDKTLKDFKSNEKDFNNIVEAIKNQPNKTTIVNKGGQYEETIGELIVEGIPQIIDKLDEATQIIPIYEDLLSYMEQREKDWEQLVQDLIDNN